MGLLNKSLLGFSYPVLPLPNEPDGPELDSEAHTWPQLTSQAQPPILHFVNTECMLSKPPSRMFKDRPTCFNSVEFRRTITGAPPCRHQFITLKLGSKRSATKPDNMDRPTSRWAAPATGGGFYDIYRGTLRNGEMVAIKCLRVFGTEEATKSLKHIARELNTWSTLQHPNVLGIHGLGVFQNRAAMISPWMENGNLMEYIHQKPEVDRFEMCKHISSGVAYLHSLEMVHGDLKSHNVLVSGDGVAKLIGFEVGSLRKSFLSSEDATTYWSGSVRWMAPELINEGDGRKKSMPTDVYALAMTILEVFTSKLPFDEHKLDPWVTLAVMEGKHPARPPELPMDTGFGDELWSLMVECWKSRPQHRPTADVITQEMDKLHSIV